MKVVKQIHELKELVRQAKAEGKSVGFVPTMGYIHEGHLSLMKLAQKEHDFIVASIFVNPLQFGPNEDFERYPRDLARDSLLIESVGVDVIFAPEVSDMYPNGFNNMLAFLDVHQVTERLCGASRPGHFRGVATVVAKLFNIVEPDAAYFGQKDAQQVVVIKRMVDDLNMNVKIVSAPIVREADGLAMSSRNVYLTPLERQAALVLHKSLGLARQMLEAGQNDVQDIVVAMRNLIGKEQLVVIDYISVCDVDDLQELSVVDRTALIALAVKVGKTRLIDNFVWGY